MNINQRIKEVIKTLDLSQFYELSKLLNHSSVKITENYSEVSKEHLQNVLELIFEKFK